jgi:hypothetical protein
MTLGAGTLFASPSDGRLKASDLRVGVRVGVRVRARVKVRVLGYLVSTNRNQKI